MHKQHIDKTEACGDDLIANVSQTALKRAANFFNQVVKPQALKNARYLPGGFVRKQITNMLVSHAVDCGFMISYSEKYDFVLFAEKVGLFTR